MGTIDTANDYGYGYHILNNFKTDTTLDAIKNLDFDGYVGAIITAFDILNIKVPDEVSITGFGDYRNVMFFFTF